MEPTTTSTAPQTTTTTKLPLGQFHPKKPKWKTCTLNPDFDCASIAVPLDYTDLKGDTINLAITRKVAADKSKRIGSLIVNPGGPGGSGIEAVNGLAYELPAEITDAFDLVGFDPRGVGESDAIECITNKDAYFAQWVDDTDPASVQKGFDANRKINEECAGNNAKLLRHLSTYESAQDLDVLREAVGDKKITYLGFSYGTRLGGVYAELFPDNIRAMVLDGAVDPNSAADASAGNGSAAGDSSTTTKVGDTTTTTIDPNLQQFDAAFADFATACDKDPKCLAHAGAKKMLDNIKTASLAKPLTVTGTGNKGRSATRGIVETGVNQALYSQDLWPALGLALADADKGDGTMLLALADAYAGRKPDGKYANLIDAFNAINCADSPERPIQADIDAAIKKISKDTPADLPKGTDCVGLPIAPFPLPDIAARLTVPVLVVGTVGDPATPYANTEKLAKALTSGVVITWEGEGHTAFPKTDCITNVVSKYLVSLTVPATDPDCPSNTVVPGDPSSSSTTAGNVTADARSPFQVDRKQISDTFVSAFVSQGATDVQAQCVAEKLVAAYDDMAIIRITANIVPDGFSQTAQKIIVGCVTG